MNLNDLYEMRDPRDAYERDVANSTSGFGKDSQAYRADGGANDERHDLDQQSSTWYIRLNGKLIRDKSGNPYSFQDKAAANKAARTMQAKLFNKDKEFMLTTNPNDKSQGVAEGEGNLAKALDTQRGNWSGWHQVDTYDPNIEKFEWDDGEGGYYASGSVEHNLQTGEIEVHYHDSENVMDVDGTFKNMGDAMRALRGDLGVNHGGQAPNFDRLGQRKQHGPDDLRKTDRTGRKGTLAGGPSNELKRSIQFNKGKHGPQGVLPEGVLEGYDDGMQPIDLSSNPSFKDIVQRYTQLVYQGHASETSPEEDQEYDEIEQYVARRFGEKGSAHLQKAGEVSYWGRDDKPYGRDSRGSNLGWPSMPVGNFRTTSKGKMHKQDAGSKKQIIGNRLGQHPAPALPEGEVDSDGYSVDHADSGEYDYEGDQARDQMNTIVRAARRLDGLLDDNENMPEWVQMKVTLAADYLDTAADYIESNQEPELEEGERGRGRPPAGQQDTTPVTPGRVEKTATGIRHHADASRYGGTEPDDDEDDHLMSKSHISRLGKMTEPDIDEGEKVGNMDADKFDSAMARLKQLAGAGPLKTVYDPTKRVYRNVPVAVQPRK